MRIVAVSDTHCCHHDIAVADGDVFVHAGDFLSFGDEVEFREFVTWLRALPHENKIVVAGNHDRFVARYPIDARAAITDTGAIYLEDELVTINEATFYGSPWTPEFMNWAFMLPRGSEIKEKWTGSPTRSTCSSLTVHPAASWTLTWVAKNCLKECSERHRRFIFLATSTSVTVSRRLKRYDSSMHR